MVPLPLTNGLNGLNGGLKVQMVLPLRSSPLPHPLALVRARTEDDRTVKSADGTLSNVDLEFTGFYTAASIFLAKCPDPMESVIIGDMRAVFMCEV